MARIIDRDPEQIMIYAKDIDTKIDNIFAKLSTSLTTIDQIMPSLNDKNCKALYKDLLEKCKKFIVCLNQLKKENEDIDTEAKRLKTILDEGMGGRSK